MEKKDPIEEARRYVANDIISRCAMLLPEPVCA
jgi:hypothetical protein